MQYINIIIAVINAIKLIEQVMPDSQGKEKFDACLKVVESVVGDISTYLPKVTVLINGLVAEYNRSGVMAALNANTTAPATTPTATPAVAGK